MGSISSFASSTLQRRAERAASAVREQADYASDAGHNAYDRFSRLLDDLQGLLGKAQKTSGRELSGLSQQMSKKLHVAGDVLDALSSDAAVAARDTLKRTNKAIRANPMQAVGIVAAVGLIIGFLIASRRD